MDISYILDEFLLMALKSLAVKNLIAYLQSRRARVTKNPKEKLQTCDDRF